MTIDQQGASQGQPQGSAVLWAGVAAWTLVLIATWPLALSFGDEVGYVGQARLLLQGQIRPSIDSPGLWFPGPRGLMAKYPLFHALLLAPALVVHPRAVFGISVLATLGLVWIAGRVMRAWGHHPAWALLFLAHPAITILSRTAMADLPFALAAVAAWWALARRRRVLAAICLGALVASKVPGAVLACLLAAGWAYGLWRAGEPRRGEMLRGLAAAGAGIVAGGVVTVAFNLLTTGTVWFGYDHSWLDGPVFGLRHLKTCGFLHLLSLLLCPPLLIVGAWSFWKRRDLGPVFAVFGFGAMMATYFFVDTAPSWAESLVLSQRLILPVVAFLLVGYADLLASLARRVRVGSAIAPVVLILLALGVSLVVSASHLRWQKPMAQALEVARATASAVGSDELALTYEASKVGLLYPGPLRAFAPGITKPPLVFCGMASASYRRPDLKAVCEFPGYRTVKTINGFAILALRPTTGFGSKNGAGAASR